jgi:hypothetical protein
MAFKWPLKIRGGVEAEGACSDSRTRRAAARIPYSSPWGTETDRPKAASEPRMVEEEGVEVNTTGRKAASETGKGAWRHRRRKEKGLQCQVNEK